MLRQFHFLRPDRGQWLPGSVSRIENLVSNDRIVSQTQRFIRFRGFALCLAFFVSIYTTSLQAQVSRPNEKERSSTQDPAVVLETLRQMISESMQQPVQDENQDQPRDPTVPTDRILQQLPKDISVKPVTQSGQKVSRPVFVPLPSLPRITLRGAVFSMPNRGTAILDVEGKSVSISLVPREQQQRIPIPATQFAAIQPALAQRAVARQQDADNRESDESEHRQLEMSLNSSFTHQGIVFNLEAFTSDSLLLNALPLGEVIIVRKETP